MMAKRPVATSNADALDGSTSKPKYAPEDFIIPAKDSKGESVRVWNRIQPGHARQISVVVNSKRFPFKTPGDVMRWCIHTGLKRIEVLEPIPSTTQQVEAMMDLLRDEMFHQEFQTFLQHATHVIQRHLNEGAAGEARRLIAQLQQKVDEMPVGHWRTKYLKAIKEQFGHVLDNKQARVSLVRFTADHED